MLSLPWLDDNCLTFPSSDQALDEPNGLLAAGGDLSAERLLSAYRRGIFPWFEDDQPILWWTPSPRTVLIPADIHISKSLAKRMRRQDYEIHCDRDFAGVIQHCAEAPRAGQDGTWISEQMQASYTQLHRLGIAHSVEVWMDDDLVAGLYGLAIGRIFYGESMFSRRDNMSKVAFVALARQLQQWQFPLIDCQVYNPHLASLGAQEIERDSFEQYLTDYTGLEGPDNWPANWGQTINDGDQ